MYAFKKSLIALIGVFTLVGIATVALPHIGRGANGPSNNAPAAQTQNVNVVNTPAVSAQQNGSWNVGINGTPNVNVMNLSSQTPFHQAISFNEGAGSNSFTTPQGKTTVIRSVSAHFMVVQGATMSQGDMLIIYVPGQPQPYVPCDCARVFLSFSHSPENHPNYETYVANETVDIRIPGGVTVTFEASLNGGTSFYADLDVFGYTE